MLNVNSPFALRPYLARHAPCADGVELCELVSSGLESTENSALARVELPSAPVHCAGQLLRLQHLVTALLTIAKRASPQGLGSELTMDCLPSHISITITSDRATQTAELGPLFEAFNAYSACLAKSQPMIEYTPRMKITSCSDRRFSRVRVGLPYPVGEERDVLSERDSDSLPSYEPCLRAG
jgi:hypothetical protein